ncbi:Cas10/Cmr2 second palm domain-containing protein, partial [Neisseria sicca]|uniref:Cas10/Cmr2 second palm domain-containing protein n=1 Tax=Neisseria sicca TaxID=490 RepID=UPI003F68B362
CGEEYGNIYRVFGGGDDFLVMGGWVEREKVGGDMGEKFEVYVGEKKGISLSGGIGVSKGGVGLRKLCVYGEEGLEEGKAYESGNDRKNGIWVYDERVGWWAWK